ncbi:hypothetical protein A0128_05490 [Leptospira tipperaryensis]|uniref:Uncharacterized protein n=1 Tax=Leptospira tipperaryensis TaxID=2564040 RepID=A0A1D7UUR6_9LEPT|nr:hypothetical protein A0128_05490 [Leptospira tipperaryensis]
MAGKSGKFSSIRKLYFFQVKYFSSIFVGTPTDFVFSKISFQNTFLENFESYLKLFFSLL